MKIRNIRGTICRGRLWWKERWFSICSAHWEYREDCNLCKAGAWTNVWNWKLNRLLESINKRDNQSVD